jgi:hypothetical protein
MKKIIITILAGFSITAWADTLTHQFQSPAFIPGNGYSTHVLTIEQLESNRKKAIADAKKAEADVAARAQANTNLQKFLNNFESRVYAQLSKQLADSMFSDTSGTTGTIEFQGTTITWDKDTVANTVSLTIVSPSGTTTVTVPIASFAF